MGKGKRLRRGRASRGVQGAGSHELAAVEAGGRLKLAVVTYPGLDTDGPSLARDVELVRASILYADEIELISPGAAMLASVLRLAETGSSGLLALLGALDDDTVQHLGGENLPKNWREIVPAAALAAQLNPAVLRALPGGDQIDSNAFQSLLEGWQSATGQFQDVAQAMFEQSGGSDLIPAVDAEILKLSSSGLNGATDAETITAGYMDLVRELLEEPSSRLLFDDAAGSLVRSLVDAGNVEPHPLALKHAGEAAVGAGLVARLPSFPQAPVDELLDLRRDLYAPLVRYRAATSRLADRVATPAFDTAMAAEIDDLWTTDVAPALVEIGEGLTEHGLVREMARASTQNVRDLIVSGSAIYVGLAAGTSVDGVAASTVAVGGAVAGTAARAAVARRAERRGVAAHELFYLYEVDRRL